MKTLKNITMFKIMIFVLLTSVGCNNTKKTTTNTKKVGESFMKIDVQSLILTKKLDYNEDQVRFKVKNITQKEDALMVDLNFSGGCVDNHLFELYSTGKPDPDGVIDLYLLHQTEDKCKMLLMQKRVFDISKLNKRKNFTKFRINKGEIITAQKAK